MNRKKQKKPKAQRRKVAVKRSCEAPQLQALQNSLAKEVQIVPPRARGTPQHSHRIRENQRESDSVSGTTGSGAGTGDLSGESSRQASRAGSVRTLEGSRLYLSTVNSRFAKGDASVHPHMRATVPKLQKSSRVIFCPRIPSAPRDTKTLFCFQLPLRGLDVV